MYRTVSSGPSAYCDVGGVDCTGVSSESVPGSSFVPCAGVAQGVCYQEVPVNLQRSRY